LQNTIVNIFTAKEPITATKSTTAVSITETYCVPPDIHAFSRSSFSSD